MAITEIAIMQDASDTLTEELKTVLDEDRKVINAWTVASNLDFEGTWVFQQVENPAVLLMGAKWANVEAHRQYMASEEHGHAVAQVVPRLAFGEDGKPKGDMYYLDADIFASSGNPSHTQLLESPVISVGRFSVAADQKEAITGKFNEFKGFVEDFAKPFVVKGAWRTESEPGSDEDWVLFIGWSSAEQHRGFGKHKGFATYRGLMPFITRFQVQHYRRVL